MTLWRFGPYTLDAPARELRRGDEAVELTPKAFDTLVYLVRNRDRVLTKDELLEALWPGLVVEESNLSQTVYVLRRALGAHAGDEALIRTVARIGYRFVGQVREVQAAAPAAPAAAPRPPPTGPAPAPASLAILPLACEPRLEYLAEGFAAGLTAELVRRTGIPVMARDSVQAFRGASVNPCEAGRALAVDAVLSGRVLEWSDRLVLSLELSDVAGGWQLWGLREERPVQQLQQLLQDVATSLARCLGTAGAAGGARRPGAATHNVEAWDLCARGRYRLNQRVRHTPHQAIECFSAALEADPDYAPAHVGLADAWCLLWLYGHQEPAAIYPLALAAAQRALELDPELAEAHAALGTIRLLHEWDWAGAQHAFERALQLNPQLSGAHFNSALLALALGEFDAARAAFQRAQALDPLSLVVRTFAGFPDYYARDADAACRQFRSVLALEPRFSIAHFRLGLGLILAGDLAGADAALRTALSFSPAEKDVLAVLGWLAGRRGDADAARAALAQLEGGGYTSGYQLALVHLGLGEADAALDQLERALAQRSYKIIYAAHDPLLDALRGQPRFQALIDRLALTRASPRAAPVPA